jgi:hypothetical protein
MRSLAQITHQQQQIETMWRKKSRSRLSTEAANNPEEQAQADAEKQTRYDREIKCGVLTLANDIPRQPPQAERQFTAEKKESAHHE